MKTLKIGSAIIHSINLSNSDGAITVDESRVELNNNNETIKLIGEANKMAFSRTRFHAALNSENEESLKNVCIEHIKENDIVKTSSKILNMLVSHLAVSDTSQWGEITLLFSDYESHGRRYLLLSLLPKKSELTSVSDDRGLVVVESETLKISDMLTTVLVDLTLLENNQLFDIATTVNKCRKVSEEEIILNALNLKFSSSVSEDTKHFVETITDFFSTADLTLKERKLASNQINDAVANSKDRPLEVETITNSLKSINGLSAKMSKHLEKAGFSTSKPIQLDNKVAKSLRRIGWSVGGVTVALTPTSIGKNVKFNPEDNSITITDLPQHIIDSIKNHV